MLKKSYRLSTEQLDRIIEKGRVFHSPFFLMRMFDPVEGGVVHIAAVAPRKTMKTAVERNRMRRRTYAALEPIIADIIKAQKAPLVALFAKPAATTAEVSELTGDLRALFVKAGIMR